ncbi:MAG TPA: hypothetical protein DCM24_02945 [Synergistaceae bacterium]|nr:hypothetical protein [Synergistaceae bacterium]
MTLKTRSIFQKGQAFLALLCEKMNNRAGNKLRPGPVVHMPSLADVFIVESLFLIPTKEPEVQVFGLTV